VAPRADGCFEGSELSNSDSEPCLIRVCVSGALSLFGGCSVCQKAVLVIGEAGERFGLGMYWSAWHSEGWFIAVTGAFDGQKSLCMFEAREAPDCASGPSY
jgi:hypothetical protein